MRGAMTPMTSSACGFLLKIYNTHLKCTEKCRHLSCLSVASVGANRRAPHTLMHLFEQIGCIDDQD